MGRVQAYLAARANYEKRKMRVRLKLGALHDNLINVRNRLRVLIRRVENDVNNKGFMEKIIKGRFKRQADRSVGGTKWETAENPSFRPLLVGTGKLRQSAVLSVAGTYRINHQFDWRVPGFPPYARAQHDGSTEHNIPSRPFMKNPNAAELTEADNFARKELNRLLKVELRK